jgi:hypothetical protein
MANDTKTRAEELLAQHQRKMAGLGGVPEGKTKSQHVLESRRNLPPEVSDSMARSVSEQRREVLESEMYSGGFREKGSGMTEPKFFDKNASTQAGVVAHNGKGLYKQAGLTAASPLGATQSGTAWRGPGGTVRQIPEVYSPLWLNSNLNLPRDRATINAWSRSFFALNPIVQNAITLHSTYPIAKLNIKSKSRKVEKFFSQMIDEIELMNVCTQIAQEFWTLGEAFVYAELDEGSAKWTRLLIQNPDYISVKHSVIAGEPIISLRPDENLRRIIMSNKPADIMQKKQLDPSIIDHVRRGENIPLNSFYVSHLARKISPYEIRGTGLIVSCFRSLMLWDKLKESKFVQADNMVNPLTLVKIGNQEFRPTPVDLEAWRDVFECHDEETEVLTDQGFKKFGEVIEWAEAMDDGVPYVASWGPVNGVKIACYNPETKEIEYREPSGAFLKNYSGEMHHYVTDDVDIKVTPDHGMWVDLGNGFQKVKSKNLMTSLLMVHPRANSDVKEFVKFITDTGKVVELSAENIKIEKYDGKVWCFTVPTGLFVTRRNSKVTIQQNSAQFDKDFKIFTHDAVNVERIGWGQGIYDTSADITQLIKETYIGLMVPSVIMDGSDTTYATGSVALDVLRQRYMQFRNMMSSWLRRKIFAPISKLNDFYEYVDGEKTLIVPEVDWNHMSLFDMSDYISNLTALAQGEGPAKKVSMQTLYRSLGLDYEDEQRKIRYEDIQDAIRTKELSSLGKYSLSALRSLGAHDEIEEVVDSPVPGESPYVEDTSAAAGGPGGPGGPMSSLPGLGGMMPGAPPSAPIGGGGPPKRPPPKPGGMPGPAPGGSPKPPPAP